MYETQSEYLRYEYSWIYNNIRENYTDEEIDRMNRAEVLEAYLKYNGIVGYANDIICCMEALFHNDTTGQFYCELAECDFDCKLDGSFK